MSYNIIRGPGIHRAPQESFYGLSGSMMAIPNTCTGMTDLWKPAKPKPAKPKPIIGDSNPRLMNGHADYGGIDLLVNIIRAIILGSSIYLAWVVWIK